MPHVDHLAQRVERNCEYADQIASVLKDRLLCDLPCTNRVAHWAYSQAEAANGLTWLRGDELLALSKEWRNYIGLAT